MFLKLKNIANNYRKHCLQKVKADNELVQWINQQLPLLKNPYYKLSTKVSWILQGLTDFPLCKTCHKKEGYFTKNIQTFSVYNEHCSVKCTNDDKDISIARTEKAMQTCIKKYGKTTFLQTDESRQKAVNTLIEKYGGKTAFTSNEVKDKARKTNLQKYNAITPFASKEVHEKSIQTCMKNFGVLFPMQSEKVKQKSKQTCLMKYGCENAAQSKEVQDKTKNTVKKRYSVDFISQSEELKEKKRKSCLEHYGCENPSQCEEIKFKKVKTSLERFGCEHPMQNHDVRLKAQHSCKLIYGCEHPMQNHDVRLKAQTRYSCKEISFDSAPELAFYIWLSDNNIKFEYQPNITFEYEFEGKKHFYMPDFLVEDQLVELKGNHFLNEDGTWRNPYDSSQDGLFEAKHQCLIKNNVKILYSDDYKKYLDYIDDKYGKEYLKKFKKF